GDSFPASLSASFSRFHVSPAMFMVPMIVWPKPLSSRERSSRAGSIRWSNARPCVVQNKNPASPPITAPTTVTANARDLSVTPASVLVLRRWSTARGFHRRGRFGGLVSRGCRHRGFVFVVLLWMRRISCFPVDPVFRKRRQFLIRRFLFLQRFLQKIRSFGMTHRAGPGHQRAVRGHLIMLRPLAASDQAGIHRGFVEVLFHHRFAFIDNARDTVAMFAPHLLVEAPENLLPPSRFF